MTIHVPKHAYSGSTNKVQVINALKKPRVVVDGRLQNLNTSLVHAYFKIAAQSQTVEKGKKSTRRLGQQQESRRHHGVAETRGRRLAQIDLNEESVMTKRANGLSAPPEKLN